jgi:hypothetical protein
MLKQASTPQKVPIQEAKSIKPPKLKEEPQKLKKIETPASLKVESIVKPKIPVVDPLPSGPPKKLETEEIKEQPKLSAKPQAKETLAKPSESERIIEPKIQATNMGLNLNPEDFMIKQRPKTVVNVPKDAKNKLKTSPFAHVSNPGVSKNIVPVTPMELIKPKTPSGFIPPSKSIKPKVQPKPITPIKQPPEIPKKSTIPPIPVSPTALIKPNHQPTTEKLIKEEVLKESPAIPQKEEVSSVQAPSWTVDAHQKAELEKSLMDLKIKRANTTKMALDFDMKELTGEITSEELAEKKQKLKTIEANIDQQIKDLEKLLGR